jgi:predicted RNA-binding protein with PIN domain
MKEVLIVDGYNIIGAWPELSELKRESLELARDRLAEILKEFQRYTGMQVMIVFDGHLSAGVRDGNDSRQTKDLTVPSRKRKTGKRKTAKFQILFSKYQETADELIERIVHEMEKQGAHIYVATSDLVEQQVTFGEGALRITANELRQRVQHAQKSIRREVKELEKKRNALGDHLDEKVAEIFEKWRRNT